MINKGLSKGAAARGAKAAGGGRVGELLDIFGALSDETRLRILKLLEHGELRVCDIVTALDTIQPKASFHLCVLKEAGLIKDRKEGRWVYYGLDQSDLFRRMLVLSALERMPGAQARRARGPKAGVLGSDAECEKAAARGETIIAAPRSGGAKGKTRKHL